ncbi:hypothetical protein JKP75_08310 [Blastococcus sp. TML/M2B]|uniref:hypothetical protein n=1 Tax=unclassified Blastococcus TaxID=2619396 RepID=UPI00190E4231|nr:MULTISPECIES: hypothetical protein [unclassified Blastococcus]MBN1092562.1 hypothetical protein [Blastococcus sp. TML/M2B]MBN1097344.1 hypothetical protein [Blastococcus sp. TML/C7B]
MGLRTEPGALAAWLVKSSRPPEQIEPGWTPGEQRELTRCVRRSYRLGLVAAGQPVLLWVSGRVTPGVHAVGIVTGPPQEPADPGPDGDDRPALPVRLTRLADPVDRGELLHDPRFRDAEVLRMPAGSNPSWLTAAQLAAVLERAGAPLLGPWVP